MPENKSKTVNGVPTPRSSLNVGAPRLLENKQKGPLARLATAYKRLNEVMSGMYTGVGCAGTPHSHHSYEDEAQSTAEKPQDEIKSL